MPSWFKKSLELKVISAVGAILIFLFTLFGVVNLWLDARGTYQLVFLQLEGLANTIQKSLIKDMREGRSSDVQQILEMVGTEKGIVSVRIFNEEGKILKSNDRAEVGGSVPDEMLLEYRAGSRDYLTDRRGVQVISIIHPIANSSQCYGCHERRNEINGVLALEYSLAPVQEYIYSHNLKMFLVLMLTLVSVGLMEFFLMRNLIGKPLNEMKTAMARAEKGNLDVVLDVGSEDEIGSLQQSFNHMLARIKELNRENIVQQRDLVRQEQELQVRSVLAEQNRALEAANRETVEKNRYYMEMLSFISHELKNPLVVLKGYTGLLLDGDLGALAHPQRDAVTAMERNVESIGEMIGNYLDLSRIERGELELNRKDLVLVEEVLKPVLDEFSEMALKASMSVRVDMENPAAIVCADPAVMKSVLMNLLSNAVKYGLPGTDIVIKVKRPEGGGTAMSVLNEGPGIPADKLERVFERFTRLESENTKRKKGSGLGLYIVRKLVELHGGRVWADSKEGAWAEISALLPDKEEIRDA